MANNIVLGVNDGTAISMEFQSSQNCMSTTCNSMILILIIQKRVLILRHTFSFCETFSFSLCKTYSRSHFVKYILILTM